jgi:cytochrome c1
MSSPTQCASLALFAKQRTTATATGPDHDAETFTGKGELPHPALVLPSQRREEVDEAVGVAIAREFVRVTKPGKRRKVSGERAVGVKSMGITPQGTDDSAL